jgi:hypothetical protein
MGCGRKVKGICGFNFSPLSEIANSLRNQVDILEVIGDFRYANGHFSVCRRDWYWVHEVRSRDNAINIYLLHVLSKSSINHNDNMG